MTTATMTTRPPSASFHTRERDSKSTALRAAGISVTVGLRGRGPDPPQSETARNPEWLQQHERLDPTKGRLCSYG
jgi:hypothetical protein